MAERVPALIRQAIAHHNRGELDDAARLYRQVLERDPRHADALHLSGVVAHQQGRHEDAVRLIDRAIAENPSAPGFRNNLAMALVALERTAEAGAALQEALDLEPGYVDALSNLANLRAGEGRFEEAVALFSRAAAADPSSMQIHYDLGRARAALGDAAGAAACYARVLEADPDHAGARQALLGYLDTLPMEVDAARLQTAVAPLLRARSLNPRSLGHAAARLIERKHALERVDCEELLADEVVRLYLRRTINVSAALEVLLTLGRAGWLAALAKAETIAPSLWDGIVAAALQCFINEYVWAVTDEEEARVDALERRIDKACANRITPDEGLVSDLLVYACYRPLWRAPWGPQIRSVRADAWPEAMAEVLRVCLHEPLEERELAASIESDAAISDRVSKAVQAQYEENPYPRWVAVTGGQAQSIEQRVQRWCPGYVAPAALRGPLRVLIAGCGTGLDAIDTALHLEHAEVDAIDLSRASLAYATRKARELGIANLHFRQQDILALGGDEGPYQVVISNGVLHHMQDAHAGLARLTPLLIPGGLVKLAFYSRLAREPLREARRIIREGGYAPREGGIRDFRQRVIGEGREGPLAELTGSTDFYSSSECRDLLFHVQEIELTLPEIGAMLADAGLTFLGFELAIAEVEQGFRREFPDAALDDLQAWDAYEQRHPHSFRAMYHFWCENRV